MRGRRSGLERSKIFVNGHGRSLILFRETVKTGERKTVITSPISVRMQILQYTIKRRTTRFLPYDDDRTRKRL